MDSMPPTGRGALEGHRNAYGDIARLMPAEITDLLTIELTKARDACKSNRGRVLAHPDIAARLTKPPFDYPTPETWNGFIPPRQIPTLAGYRVNPSRRRAAFMRLMDDVAEREQTQ